MILVGEILSFWLICLSFWENLLEFSEKIKFWSNIFRKFFPKLNKWREKNGFQLANYWVFNKLAWVFWGKLLEFFRDPPWVFFEMSKKKPALAVPKSTNLMFLDWRPTLCQDTSTFLWNLLASTSEDNYGIPGL